MISNSKNDYSMKRCFLTLIFVLIVAISSFAESIRIEGLQYQLIQDNNAILVHCYSPEKNIDIPSHINYDGEDYMVTEIGKSAFYDCKNIESVKIPNSVKFIGDYAFQSCIQLKSLIIPNSVTTIGDYAFATCNSISSLEIGESVKKIGRQAFACCEKLTRVVIPDSVESIGDYAFQQCFNLTEATIGLSVTEIGEEVFDYTNLRTLYFNAENCLNCSYSSHSYSPFVTGTVVITDNDQYHPFTIYRSPQNIIFGSRVKSIPQNAFRNCQDLTSINIPDSVSYIGEYAFANCINIESATIGKSLKKADNKAFSNCRNLETVIWNAEECISAQMGDSVKTVVFGENVRTIPQYAFSGCKNIKCVDIPNSVTKIYRNAFSGCSGLTTLNIGNSVTLIEVAAFDGCSALNSLNLGNSVTTIVASAFRGCCSLTSLTLPKSVKRIGEYAFYGCDNLEELYFNCENCTECGITVYPLRLAFNSDIKSLVIGEDVKNIPDKTFYFCTIDTLFFNAVDCTIHERAFPSKTRELIIGDHVINIPDNAFQFLDITSIVLPDNVLTIGDMAFAYCDLDSINIPNSIVSVGNGAFMHCSNLISAKLPNSITAINDDTFRRCESLQSIDIPATVISIGARTFQYCQTLKSVTLSDNVKSIGEEAFLNCTGLTNVNIPNSLNEISNQTFCCCSSLKDIIIPNSVTLIGEKAFYGCDSLTSVKIGKAVKEIRNEAFTACYNMSCIRIDNVNDWARIQFANISDNPLSKVESLFVGNSQDPIKNLVIDGNTPIGSYAFPYLADLERVRIKDGAAIGTNAFWGCDNLTDICIYSEKIGKLAFYSHWSKITNIYVPMPTPPSCPNDAFSDYDYHKTNLYVPLGSAAIYKNAPTCWCNFSNIIETDFSQLDLDTLFAADYTGIDNIEYYMATTPLGDKISDIYNLQGVCLKKNATEDFIQSLPRGLYIIGGKKIFVK